jgi:hypothetical protein
VLSGVVLCCKQSEPGTSGTNEKSERMIPAESSTSAESSVTAESSTPVESSTPAESSTPRESSTPVESGIPGVPLRMPPKLRDFYWALPRDQDVLLVYLNSQSGPGSIYSAWVWHPICSVTTDSSGNVAFQAAPEGEGLVLHFTGRAIDDSLVGTMRWVRRRTGVVKDSQPITFRRIHARFLDGASDSVSGQYESLSFNNDDAYGLGWIIVETVDGVVGFAWEYEGGAGPLQKVKVEQSGDTLRIPWQRGEMFQVDTALIRHGGLRFIGSGDRVSKAASLRKLITNVDESECK